MEKEEIRGGVLRMGAHLMVHFVNDLFTGKAKFIDKGLTLRGIRRCDGDIPMLSTYYDFFFTGDTLPVVEEGMWPPFVMREKVEGTKGCYRLVLDTCLNKNEK